ncbi:MAG: DNA repair protein RecN [Terrimonas sp.]|nr:DNA repair protein RecN [Terrimonas sp.]
MLKRISIRNYAIIDQLEIDFSAKLNIITGETGAGKSIIVGALGLILGNRADTAVSFRKDQKCVIEGIFNTDTKKSIREFLLQQDLDADDELVLRREIIQTGKSRAFINDTPVNLTQLKELSLLLVDLHQQFDSLELGQTDFQREVLDALAGRPESITQYQQLFRKWQDAKKQLDALKEQKLAFDREYDYNQFQFNELEEAGFRENELEEIDAELKLFSHAEGIIAALNQVRFVLSETEAPVVQQLRVLVNQLQGYAAYQPSLPGIIERLQSAQIELEDIVDEVEHISGHIHYDNEKIASLNERLSTGYKLLKKHAVQTTNELIQVQEGLAEKLQAVLNIETAIQQTENETNRLLEQAMTAAMAISASRKEQMKPLEVKVNKLLAQVGMPNARLKVEQKQIPLNITGSDEVTFLFDANKSGQFLPVGKVASGGELSRLMLCIKSLVAESIDLPTLIFDEIDTGISGEAAKQVGLIMKSLAGKRQVISITHQPQIAGQADAHFFVFKEVIKEEVKTNIRLLNTEERVIAIARMLSGEKPTAAAIENAREMVGQ